MQIDYNHHDWYDKDGHLYYLEANGKPNNNIKEPLFFARIMGK
jgi:hypothetical protein